MELILASASPRRAELLRSAGFSFRVLPAEIDETPREGESASDYAMRMARERVQPFQWLALALGAAGIGVAA